MNTNPHRRDITTDEQRLVLQYIKQNPNQTNEDIVNFFCGAGFGWDSVRRVYAEAVEFLVQNDYADRDETTQAITAKAGTK